MSPREIDMILTELRAHKAQLDRIEAHAAKTNGRVTHLELWRAKIEGVRAAVSWVPTVFVSVATGVLVYALTH